ncbi:MAG TPA: hypothetical protein PK950_01035 [Candidatus Paceibacterota bacterium]|nr:hypothetical protein [Candidatus Paceibacterota bacterium]
MAKFSVGSAFREKRTAIENVMIGILTNIDHPITIPVPGLSEEQMSHQLKNAISKKPFMLIAVDQRAPISPPEIEEGRFQSLEEIFAEGDKKFNSAAVSEIIDFDELVLNDPDWQNLSVAHVEPVEIDALYMLTDDDWKSIYSALQELDSVSITPSEQWHMKVIMENCIRILCGKRGSVKALTVHDILMKVNKTHGFLPVHAQKVFDCVHPKFCTTHEEIYEKDMYIQQRLSLRPGKAPTRIKN